MQSKTILVLGGAGFIGSYVNKLLHMTGYQTIVLDNLSRGRKEMTNRGIFIEGDIGNRNDLEKIFSTHQIDAVLHFAALIDVGESIRAPALYYRNNVANTLILLETMVQHGIKTLIFSSSAAVYGIPKTNVINETHPCHPINPYGKTKWIIEEVLKDFDTAYGMKSVSLRYFNAAGADPDGEIKNHKPKESNLIPLVLRSLKRMHEPLVIFGTDYPTPDGTCIRDYIHIHDLATAHLSAMEMLFQGGDSSIYNLGYGHGYSVREIIASVERILGREILAIEGPRRIGDPHSLIACSKKAIKELHWKPRYSLDEIITHAWNSLT